MEKEFLIQRLEEALTLEVKHVYFGFSNPLPSLPAPLNFLSRITIPLKGKLEMTASFDGKIEKKIFKPGDILFTGRNGWALASRDDKTYKAVSIVLMKDCIRTVYSEFEKGKIKKNPWYHTSSGMKGILFHTVQALNELMTDFGNDRFQRAEALIKTMLGQTIIEMRKDRPLRISKSERTLALIKDYIMTNCHLPVNRESISSDLRMNPSYISRLFSEKTGETINAFLNKARMEKATFILKNHDAPIEQIAGLCGYSSPGYFVKVFKKFYGITPGAFRNREKIF